MGKELNPVQKKIVEARSSNLLVSAGAGTGKTTVLVERFLALVMEGAAQVTEILALTFTDKAASEMKSRIMQRFNETGFYHARRDLEAAYIMTFHAFASRILKEHPIEAAIDPEFTVIKQEEADLLKEEALTKTFEEHASEEAVFRLLKIYGESGLREGMIKIHRAAGTEGKSLEDYFEAYRNFSACEVKEIPVLLNALNESALLSEWQ